MLSLRPLLPTLPSAAPGRTAETRPSETGRSDWWLWAVSATAAFVLALPVLIYLLPSLLGRWNSRLEIRLVQAAACLVALVILFYAFSLYHLVLIRRLRKQLLEEAVRTEEYRQLAMFDPLTGVYNRRYAEARIGEEIARCQRHSLPLTVAVLDLDDFKTINDNYGHLAGDEALREFAQKLQRASRGSDLVARLGGDEFLLILPECPPNQLQTVLDRLQNLTIEFQGQKIPIHFSAGWTSYSPGASADQLIHNADQALYASKRDVGIATNPSPSPA